MIKNHLSKSKIQAIVQKKQFILFEFFLLLILFSAIVIQQSKSSYSVPQKKTTLSEITPTKKIIKKSLNNRKQLSNVKGIATHSAQIERKFVTYSSNIQIPVLMYHYIRNYTYPGDPEGHALSTSIPDFKNQMNYLKTNGYTPITLDTMYAIIKGKVTSPSKPVVLTFDDGTIDFYANAYPILKEYNFKATSFVITGYVGRPANLSWSNIHEMEKSGLISFEDHTVNHRNLTTLNYQTIYMEVQSSKDLLQNETGKTVNFIAYPYGGSNSSVWSIVEKSGYVGGFGTWYGKVNRITMDMPRVRVSGGESITAFKDSL